MEALGKLFGSEARVKLLRLFLFNDDTSYVLPDIAVRAKVSKDTTRKELQHLVSAGILRKRAVKGKAHYSADQRFPHYEALVAFIRTSAGVSDLRINTSIKKAGAIRLVVLSGLFTGAVDSKVDLLVVADKLEERHLTAAVRSLEAELGRELRYASFPTADFRYRLGVYDRLIRDVFEYPHRTILDRIGV